DRLRNFLVAIELHRERGPPLRRRAQIGGVAEHGRERNACADRLRVAARLQAFDAAPARVEIAHHVAEILLGRHDLDGHNGFEKLRLRTLFGVLERHRTGDLERHLARVDLVERAVDQLDPNVDDRVAGQNARFHRLLDAEVDRRDVLLGNLAADDLVDELVAVAGIHRLEVDHGVAVLATAAGLADEASLDLLDRPADGLTVSDLWAADVRVDVELTRQPVDDDLQVELAHARDQGLARLLVSADAEGRILLGETLQAGAQLVLVALGLRLDRDGDHRLREVHRLEADRCRVRGQRVAGGRALEADRRGDLARHDLLALFAVVGVHLEDAADALGLAGRRVQDSVAG